MIEPRQRHHSRRTRLRREVGLLRRRTALADATRRKNPVSRRAPELPTSLGGKSRSWLAPFRTRHDSPRSCGLSNASEVGARVERRSRTFLDRAEHEPQAELGLVNGASLQSPVPCSASERCRRACGQQIRLGGERRARAAPYPHRCADAVARRTVSYEVRKPACAPHGRGELSAQQRPPSTQAHCRLIVSH